jgi:hypothetical protein
MPATDTPAGAGFNPNPPPSARRCDNCGTPLLGEICYACGQSTRGLIRRFGSIVGDFLDTVLNIDSRVFRTIGPLLTRPGYLSLQYFEGHRVRYVSPVRLFVFLSILAFLAAQWSLNLSGGDGGAIRLGTGADTTIGNAETPAQVRAERDKALAGIEQARRKNANVPGLDAGLKAAEVEVRKQADARIRELEARGKDKPQVVTDAPSPGIGPPPGVGTPDKDSAPPRPQDVDPAESFQFNGKPWDAKTNPVTIGWLPAAANAQLNRWIGRARGNIGRIQKDPNLLKDAFLSVLPQVLFVLLPVFALLLKVLYLFKRRLYMEHLVVALHSHAFLCAVLLLQSLLSLLGGLVAPDGGFVGGVFGWTEGLLWAWMPLYLLLMQKRVYGQGWLMTGLKYVVVGCAYWVLLTIGIMVAGLISLVRM